MIPPFQLRQERKQALSQKQTQRLIMSTRMQQGIYFLQLPVQELESKIEEELEENPLLEILEEEDQEEEEEDQESTPEEELSFDEKNFEMLLRIDEEFKENLYLEGASLKNSQDAELQTFLSSMMQKRETLFENLMKQAEETLGEKEDIAIAEAIIGSLDEKGFLTTPLDEIAFLSNTTESKVKNVLMKVQEFDPPGIGGTSLKDSLLIQLRRQKKEDTLAFLIIKNHFNELIQNKIHLIKTKLKVSVESINEAINEHISSLDLSPGNQFAENSPKEIVPDLSIIEEEGNIVVRVNNERIPELSLNRKYLAMFQDKSLTKEEKDFLKHKIESAKWLIKNIFQRQSTIQRIGNWLLEKQRSFFSEAKGRLVPATMSEVASDLELHESTIVRAIAHKYLYCDKGMFPLRKFFTASYVSSTGEIFSAKTVKDTLKEVIDTENKKQPLSDQLLEKELKKKGISCARRTIAKYRMELNIPNAHQRRVF